MRHRLDAAQRDGIKLDVPRAAIIEIKLVGSTFYEFDLQGQGEMPRPGLGTTPGRKFQPAQNLGKDNLAVLKKFPLEGYHRDYFLSAPLLRPCANSLNRWRADMF